VSGGEKEKEREIQVAMKGKAKSFDSSSVLICKGFADLLNIVLSLPLLPIMCSFAEGEQATNGSPPSPLLYPNVAYGRRTS
jgi:hypothetical protein